DGLTRPEERLLAGPGQSILSLLHERAAFCHDGSRYLIGHRSCGRAFLHRIGEDAEPIEADVLDKAEEIVELRLRLSRESHQHRGPTRQSGDRVPELREDVLHAT